MNPPETSAKQAHWPLILALIVFAAGLAVVGLRLYGYSRPLAYPTDDSYIHMALAKNLAADGTWGINEGAFAPASSSPIWTVLLMMAFKVLGIHSWIPFALSTLCALALLVFVDSAGRGEGWPPYLRSAVLVLMVLVTPFVPLAVVGMEPLLFVLFTIWVLYSIWRLPLRRGPIPGSLTAKLLIACFLATSARYEGLFIATAAAFILILHGRRLLAMAVLAVSAAPVALFGAFSVTHGWSWLPSSVRLKGNVPDTFSVVHVIGGIVLHIWSNLHSEHFLIRFWLVSALLAPLMVLALLPARWRDDRAVSTVGVYLLVVVQHLAFAGTNWFYRYEAYFMASQVFVIGLIVAGPLPRESILNGVRARLKTVPGLAVLALVLALSGSELARGFKAILGTAAAMKNIRDQQCQMAEFVRHYYPGATVAVNDIGAISYRGGVKVVDLFGLADHAVFEARLHRDFTTQFIQRYCDDQKVTIAMVYDSWFTGKASLPKQWQLAGTLEITHNVVCAEPMVSFYAVGPATAAKLIENLRDFAKRVPFDVRVSPR